MFDGSQVAIVTQVISGDTLIIRDKTRQKSVEKTFTLTNIVAPRLGRKIGSWEDKDESFAWEAREYLRKKLIGKKIRLIVDPIPILNAANLERGRIFYPENVDVAEELVSNGLVEVDKNFNSEKVNGGSYWRRLIELEEEAKREARGKWKKCKAKHVRDINYVKNYTKFFEKHQHKPILAIVERVTDCEHLIMMETLLLPNYHVISFAISGIKLLPKSNEFKKEALSLTKKWLLQRDNISVVIEQCGDANNFPHFFGRVIHPEVNIAELLLKGGFVGFDKSSITNSSIDNVLALNNAEMYAADRLLRCWKPTKEGFRAVVTKIIDEDTIEVKECRSEELVKIDLWFSRHKKSNIESGRCNFTWIFLRPSNKAKEYLRKKLVGKCVTVHVLFEMKCSLTLKDCDVGDLLEKEGLATIFRDPSLSDVLTCSNSSLVEQLRTVQNQNRYADLFSLMKAPKTVPVFVKSVISGTVMRIFTFPNLIPVTFRLSGINCCELSKKQNYAEVEFEDDEALQIAKQLEEDFAEIVIKSRTKDGIIIGSLFHNHLMNFAELLVEKGLAMVESSCADASLLNAAVTYRRRRISMLEDWTWSDSDEEEYEVRYILNEKTTNAARRIGLPVETYRKWDAGSNKQRRTDLAFLLDGKHETISALTSKLIRTFRQRKNLSQKDLAIKINEKIEVVKKYENGKALVDQNIIEKMEKILDVRLRGRFCGKPIKPLSYSSFIEWLDFMVDEFDDFFSWYPFDYDFSY